MQGREVTLANVPVTVTSAVVSTRMQGREVTLAHVPVTVTGPDHVRDGRLLFIHWLAVDLGGRDHAELAHLILMEPAQRRPDHLRV